MRGCFPRKGPTMKVCVAAAAVSLLALAGCGSDGTSTIREPHQNPRVEAALVGTVRMPDGQFAALHPLQRFFDRFQLISRALAGAPRHPDIFPVDSHHLVTLSRVNAIDVAHGNTEGALLVGAAETDEKGEYAIIDADAREVAVKCRLMASVGGRPHTTRSFVWKHEADLDVVSETVVRLVLNRLTLAPAVQLCDFFSESAFTYLTDEVQRATYAASGSTIEELYESAYSYAAAAGCVRKAIADITGGEYADGRGPIVCPAR